MFVLVCTFCSQQRCCCDACPTAREYLFLLSPFRRNHGAGDRVPSKIKITSLTPVSRGHVRTRYTVMITILIAATADDTRERFSRQTLFFFSLSLISDGRGVSPGPDVPSSCVAIGADIDIDRTHSGDVSTMRPAAAAGEKLQHHNVRVHT